MEQIVAKLLVPNNKTIQEGTKELKEAFKNPEAVPALCDVVVSSANAEIRQTAAVLLRRRLGKRQHWSKIDEVTRNRIKQGMLQAVVNEKEKTVKASIVQFVGILGKHEFVEKTWPELLQFVHTLCSSDNPIDKEMGMYTLSIMTEISKDSYIVHAESFAILFSNILNSLTELHSELAYYTVLTMKHLVPIIGGHQQMINVYHTLLPRVLEIINSYSDKDEKRTCELYEIIEEMIEYAVAAIIPHVQIIVEICLRIGTNRQLSSAVRIKAIGVLGWLIRAKSKAVQKHKLIEPIIDNLIQIMAEKPESDEEEDKDQEYFQSIPDEYTTITIATQTLDLIALHVPPDKVIPFLLTRVEPALQGTDIYAQKAGYLALAVLAEGCSEFIRKKYLQSFLKCVCGAIGCPCVIVRNAALFALGQFAEHLQPEISQYASELLPVLFEYINQICVQMEKTKTEPASLDRVFYALETFCENLDKELLPYLPTLMERLLYALNPNQWSLKLKKIAFDALGAAANAVQDGMLPYFPKILEIINAYVNADPMSDNHHLECEAIECLATVAQTIGNDNFRPLAAETVQLGLRIIDSTNDPDTRRAVYSLFGALATVLKEEIAPALPKVVEQMIETIQSSEGIESHYEEEETEDLDVYDDLSDTPDDYEEDIASISSGDSSQCKYTVENSYIEEKEQACVTLRQICENTGAVFLPYLEKSFEEIFKLLNFPQDDIRKAAIMALQEFCVSFYKTNTESGKQALYKALQMFIPKCAEIIRSDEERNVVMCALDCYKYLLENVKHDVLVGEGHREAIMNCVIDVLTLKTSCQDADLDPTPDNEEDGEAEQDEMLLEYAGDVIPQFGNAITPDDFVLYFPNILNLVGNRTKKQNSESQRSFSYGTLAECMKPLDVYVEKFVPQLMQLWLAGAKDKCDEVRQNSIFGLGEMVLHGKSSVFPHYTEILQALSATVGKESHAGTLDNICGALAKIILTNSSLVPLEQVFPAFLQRLPLKQDFQENRAVVKCFYSLYQQGNPILRQNLEAVIKIIVLIYHNKQTADEETRTLLIEVLKTINHDFGPEFANVVSSSGPAVTESVQKLFTS